MESTPKKASSHGWSGIMAGKEVLEKGLGYLVGNGESINVWQDPWLSLSQPMSPFGPPTLENQNLRVHDLLLPDSNEWNLDMVRLHLPYYEEMIRQIIPSAHKPLDKLVWLGEVNGRYSTKTGYRMANAHPPIQYPYGFEWMRHVWKLDASAKIQHFLWRALNNALPVAELLIHRGMEVDPACKVCGNLETINHVLFECPFALRVWKLAPIHSPIPHSLPPISLQLLLTQVSKIINLPPSGLTCSPLSPWILWNL